VPRRFLEVAHRDILVGDAAASTALRIEPAAGGSLRRCTRLFTCLTHAIGICEYAWNDIPVDPEYTYILPSEPTYLAAVYERTLRVRGARVLRRAYGDAAYEVIRAGDPILNDYVARPLERRSLSPDDRQRVRSYLRERVDEPTKHMRYMPSHNRADAVLRDRDGKPLTLGDDELYAVVFLHSFDDGQYFFGVDGYEDIYHWTTTTIDELLKNREVRHVLIKEHPTIQSGLYEGDRVAAHILRAEYQEDQRVKWLSADTSPKALARGRAVGLTHHGSVAEELVFLGIPVIASVYSPWADRYRFARVWHTPDAYESMLRALSSGDWRPVSAGESEELYRFVRDYRIDVAPESVRGVLNKVHAWRGDQPPLTAADYPALGRYLARLRAESEEMASILADLVARHVDLVGPQDSTRWITKTASAREPAE
jgi:hypothetical protein